MRKPLPNKSWPMLYRVGWSVPIGFVLASMLLLSPIRGNMRPLSPRTAASPATTATPCTRNADCSDGVFCNGSERCLPSSPVADARGCVAPAGPPCSAEDRCDEDQNQCVMPTPIPCEDADRDGQTSARCGGTDCDDNDPLRYRGNSEVCDAEGYDEDCDPFTYGYRDRDGDGEDDNRCMNRDTLRSPFSRRGTDPDDNNPAIRAGSMVCEGADVVVSGSKAIPCPTGTKCVAQPNGTGVCMVPPADYLPPPLPTPRPPLPTLSELGSGRPTATSSPTSSSRNEAATSVVNVATGTLVTKSADGDAAEVKVCKSILQSGKVSWGGGTTWAPENIDKLCNGTKNAKETIACFQSIVDALGWAAAIDKCK